MNMYKTLLLMAVVLASPMALAQEAREGMARPMAGPMGPMRGAPAPMKKVPFLGVATENASPALRSQLGLAEGMGLVLKDVVDDSPADKAGLKKFDVLVRFNDQMIVDMRQLQVLVNNSKEGQSVNLTIIRQAKEQTLPVKIGMHEVPKFRPQMFHGPTMMPGMGGHGMGMHMDGACPFCAMHHAMGHPGMGGGMMTPRMGEGPRGPMPGGPMPGMPFMGPRPGFGPGNPQTKPAEPRDGLQSLQNWEDNEYLLTVTTQDGKKSLKAIRKSNREVIFDGPINTPEERQKMPESISTRLDQMEKGAQMNVRPALKEDTEDPAYMDEEESDLGEALGVDEDEDIE